MKKHYNFNSQSNRPSNTIKRLKDKKLERDLDYYKNALSFTPKQQKVQQRILQNRAGTPHEALRYYIPGAGNPKAAFFLLTLIMSSYCIGMAGATSINEGPRNNKGIGESSNNDKKNNIISKSCSSTNIITQNKPVGALMSSQYNPNIKTYGFFSEPPQNMLQEKWIKSVSDYSKIYSHYDISQQRQTAFSSVLNKFKELVYKCSNTGISIDNNIQENIVNQVIGNKIAAYQLVNSVYSSGQPIGNCDEIAQQACLTILPELEPDNEFFVKITCETRESSTDHVYGMIISKDILEGKGLSLEDKNIFIKKFYNPFFNEGFSTISLCGNEIECEYNTNLFWKALGIHNKQVKRIDIAGQVKICDPYMGTGLYCDLNSCFSDKKIAMTYLHALEKITEVKIYTWSIPNRLKLKVNHNINCLNQEVNNMILDFNKKLKDIMIETDEGNLI